MAKSPAVLWYTGDYLVGVLGMTWEEQGRYTYLLNIQHQKGHFNIDMIMPDCPDSVREKFIQDEDGLYYNERMEKEILKRDKFVESRRKNASKKKPEENDESEKAYAEHMGNENRNENEIVITDVEVADVYSQVINYLNNRAGTNYRASGKDFRKRVDEKLKDGFTLDDFYKVIDNKCNEWIGTEWEKYLRPRTLFGDKFEEYLNQRTRHSSGNGFWDLLQELS